MTQSPLALALGALMDKYVALIALRQSREALEARGVWRLDGAAAALRRAEARRLAADFPGALRELEQFTASQLQVRLRQVRREYRAALGAPRRRRAAERWIRLVLDYHAGLRAGLAIRRWWVAHRAKDWSRADLEVQFRSWYERSPIGGRSAKGFDGRRLARYLQPPNGRLTDLVWQDLAVRHRLTEATLRRLVFGADQPEEPCAK